MGNRPLSDLKVLELANVLAGPSIGMFLAELGASVIKVENMISQGDVTRQWKLPTEDPQNDISGYFSSVNWGKKSIAVDLCQPEGMIVIYALARQSDIVLSSYKPGDAEKPKVDYNTLRQLNEKIIYAHVTGYGMNNNRAGYDAIIQAETGFTYINGEPDGKPTKMPVALMDVLAAHQLKEAILLALMQRDKTGKGEFVDVSLFHSGLASLVNQAANWLVGRSIPRRLGSDHPNIVPYGTIFTTSDNKEIVLAVGTDKQFKELCAVLGNPELGYNDDYETNVDRVKNSTAIKDILQELISQFSREEILEILKDKRIPAGGVFNMKEVFDVPEAKDMVIQSPLDDTAYIRGVRSVAFHSSVMEIVKDLNRPPHYGEHSMEILKEVLGYKEEEIKSLIEKGAVYGK
jgi:crotonobetainyl-CoA:carnitine CoA-transferase CaiB-like acyl-CoA transferase